MFLSFGSQRKILIDCSKIYVVKLLFFQCTSTNHTLICLVCSNLFIYFRRAFFYCVHKSSFFSPWFWSGFICHVQTSRRICEFLIRKATSHLSLWQGTYEFKQNESQFFKSTLRCRVHERWFLENEKVYFYTFIIMLASILGSKLLNIFTFYSVFNK